MQFIAIILSLVYYGSFLLARAVPVTDTINTLLSSRELTTSDVRTRDIHNGYGTGYTIRRSFSTDKSEEDQVFPRSQQSDFLEVAVYVNILYDHYARGSKIPHAFGGDIMNAYDKKSATGPFETISIYVPRSFLDVAKQALYTGHKSSSGIWSLQAKGEKVVLSRKGRDDISAEVSFTATDELKIRNVEMPGHATLYLPVLDQFQESNFLDLACFVSLFLEHYAWENEVPHAFSGDIVKAYNAKSPSGPFHTMSLIMEHKFLPVAEKALKDGYKSRHGWYLRTQAEGNGEKVVLSRKDCDDVSAAITFTGIDQEIVPQLVQMPGHPTVYLPILISPKKFPFNLRIFQVALTESQETGLLKTSSQDLIAEDEVFSVMRFRVVHLKDERGV